MSWLWIAYGAGSCPPCGGVERRASRISIRERQNVLSSDSGLLFHRGTDVGTGHGGFCERSRRDARSVVWTAGEAFPALPPSSPPCRSGRVQRAAGLIVHMRGLDSSCSIAQELAPQSQKAVSDSPYDTILSTRPLRWSARLSAASATGRRNGDPFMKF